MKRRITLLFLLTSAPFGAIAWNFPTMPIGRMASEK